MTYTKPSLFAAAALLFATSVFAQNAFVSIDYNVTPQPLVAGTDGTWTVDVNNEGPADATNLTVTFPMPAPTTFTSASVPATWSCTTPAPGANGTITCTSPLLSPGTATLVFTLGIPANTPGGTTLTTTASVTATSPDPRSSDNSFTTSADVESHSALSIAKSGGNGTLIAGSPVTYTIDATASGPSDAANTTVTDPLPPELRFQSLSAPAGWSCTTPAVNTHGTVTCTHPSFMGTATFTIQTTIDPATPSGTSITNTATITADVTAQNTSDDTASVTSSPTQPVADLGVTLNGTQSNTTLTYTGTVSNGEPDDASNATLTITLPAQATFASLTPPAGWSCTTGSTVTCTIATFAHGAANPFTVTATIPVATPNGTTLTATANVSSPTYDPSNTNNSATSTLMSGFTADVAVTLSGTQSVRTMTYSGTAANNGPNDAANATLIITLPASLTFTSFTPPPGWSCTTGATTTCTRALFPSGTSNPFTLVATLAPSTADATPIAVTATIASNASDPNSTNNTAVATNTVAATADLAVTINGTASGNNINYTVGATNNGPFDAANVHVVVTLSPDANFLSMAPPPSWTCTAPQVGTSGTIDCTTPTFPANGTATINIVTSRSPYAQPGATFTTTATITSTTPDPNAANGSGSTSNAPAPGSANVPTLSVWMMVALGAALAVTALRR